jgi:hypothetical protein
MVLKLHSRIRETTISVGSDPYTLDGAVQGFETFASHVASGDTTYYFAEDETSSNWEVGIGTMAGAIMARTTILASSNNNAPVLWATGVKTVTLGMPGPSDLVDHNKRMASLMLADSPVALTNLLINGDGRINQRAAASVADDVYGHDRWYGLHNATGAMGVSTITDVENGTPYMWRLNQPDFAGARIGYAQIVEAANSKYLRGKTLTLYGRVRLGVTAAIRYAILAWTGAADNVTSDVVLNWASTSWTAGGFFLASNVTVVGVGTMTPTINVLTDLTPLTATLPASVNNIIVLIWTENAIAQNIKLDAALQLEVGTIVTMRESRPTQIELVMCQRYFETSTNIWTGNVTSGSTYYVRGYYMVTKRTLPVVTLTDLGSYISFPNVSGSGTGTVSAFAESRIANATANGMFQSSAVINAEL